MANASQWIVLAEILRPQGRRGEVLAELLTDFPDRFTGHPNVWLAPAGFADGTTPASDDDGALTLPAQIIAHWLPTGRNAGRIVLHFAGSSTIEHAEALAGKQVIVPLDERLPLDADSAYISDLVGATVYDCDLPVGVVQEVQFATSADGAHRLDDAAPLLALANPAGEEILVPFVSAFIVSIDLAAKSIRMMLPEGLTEINSQTSSIPASRTDPSG